MVQSYSINMPSEPSEGRNSEQNLNQRLLPVKEIDIEETRTTIDMSQ